MNLFNYETPKKGERFERLLVDGCVEIVRIVSGEVKEQSFCDERDEWVVLLKGSAVVVMGEEIELRAGDTLFIPAERKHLLKKVEPGSLWLAVHIKK